MKSDPKIAEAITFAWERPARKPMRVWPVLVILLLLVAHAGFSFFVLVVLPHLLGAWRLWW